MHKSLTELEHVILADRALAVTLLASSDGNRGLDLARVLQLAEAMRNGTFDGLRTPIRIDQSGRLVDGHHRLHAVALTYPDRVTLRVVRVLLAESHG